MQQHRGVGLNHGLGVNQMRRLDNRNYRTDQVHYIRGRHAVNTTCHLTYSLHQDVHVPYPSKFDHPRFQPTFLRDLAYPSNRDIPQSLVTRQHSNMRLPSMAPEQVVTSSHPPTSQGGHSRGRATTGDVLARPLHPLPVAVGGVDPREVRRVREFHTTDVHPASSEPPRYSNLFPCEGGWKLEGQVGNMPLCLARQTLHGCRE